MQKPKQCPKCSSTNLEEIPNGYQCNDCNYIVKRKETDLSLVGDILEIAADIIEAIVDIVT